MERRLLPQRLMARRVGALLAIAILVALVLVLVSNVYRHHEQMHETDETVVQMDDGIPVSVVIFAGSFG